MHPQQDKTKATEAAQIDSGKIKPVIEETSLGNVVNQVLKKIHPMADKKKVFLIFPTLAQAITINTDAKLLTRILEEIMENAVKYSHPKNDVELHIKLQQNGVLLEVKDSGLGIPQKEQTNVFSKYFRGGNVTNIPGEGLGLYIALAYTNSLGGRMWFLSKRNWGTTMSVYLPT